jgi:hypothetical protein
MTKGEMINPGDLPPEILKAVEPKIQKGILMDEKTISISMIFRWYKIDFGGSDQALLDTLLTHLDEGKDKAFLEKNRGQIRIRYQPYDWNLNQSER